jgi:hypothetical protein
MSNYQHIEIEDDGRLLAEADVHIKDGALQAALRVESGHIPPGTRSRLVDAVLDLARVEAGTPLEMTVPAGDGEMLQRVRERCTSLDTHAAGASCRVFATVPPR